MQARLKRTVLVLATVLLAFGLYRLLAVPLIEPSLPLAESSSAGPLARSSKRSFEKFFPAGAWELDRPKVLEIDQGTLLFADYEVRPDGQIRLKRCTLIAMFQDGQSEEPYDRPVILRAASGATIDFDSPLNLLGGRLGRITGGRLEGEVTITSPSSSPDADDALEIVTRNVQIDEQRIWTPHPVRFEYGHSSGSGRDLLIELQPSTTADQPQQDGKDGGQISRLELGELQRAEILVPSGVLDLTAGSLANPDSSGQSTARQESPVEVKCDGPLQFDFQKNLLSLSDQVDVIRHGVDGPSDQLNCERLEIHFSAESPQRGARAQQAGDPEDDSQSASRSITPQKLVAIGYPAILRGPSHKAGARAERIEFDFATRRLRMKDREKLTLYNETFHAEAPEIEYQIPQRGRLGALWASGPGRFQGQLKGTGEDSAGGSAEAGRQTDGEAQEVKTPGERLEGRWANQLRLLPQGETHVLSIEGQAELSLDGASQLAADEIHAYLVERQFDSGKTEIQFARLRAVEQVRVESPRFSGAVQEANIWFRQPSSSEQDSSEQDSREQGPREQQGSQGEIVGSQGGAAQRQRGWSRFHLTADQFNAQVLLGQSPQLERLSVRGDVQVTEKAGGDQPPVSLAGERFELEDGLTHPRAQLEGNPARASLRGLTVVGTTIAVHQHANRLDVSGPGNLILPQEPRETGRPAALPPLHVRWQGGMTFDGRRAHFQQDVAVQASRRTDKGETLQLSCSSDSFDVSLTRPIDLQHPPRDRTVDVHELRFHGWAFLESRWLDARRTQKSFDQMQVHDLTVDRQTGRIHGDGPGWLVHRGIAQRSGGERQSSRLPGSSTGLSYLRVDFQREMAGNLNRRQIDFTDRTKTLYGPIESWEETLSVESPQQLRSSDVLLTCERLAIADMGSADQGLEALELQATGNATIQGDAFFGSGDRLAYARSKDQLILEGDGRREAYLKFQTAASSRPVEWRLGKILFNPGSKNFKLQDIQSIEVPSVDQLRTGRRRSGFSR